MYPSDRSFLKISVGLMLLLDSFHSILIMHTCYHYLVSSYFNILELTFAVWSIRISVAFTGLIATLGHAFFSRRIHQFSKNRYIAVFVMLVSVCRTMLSIATTAISFTTPTFLQFEKYSFLICIGLGLNMLSDICVTVSLCWFLRKSKTGFPKTDSIIDNLLLYMINAGVLTVVYNGSMLACALTMPNNLIYIGGLFLISKLYTNSLLAVVNSRKGILRESENGSFELADLEVDQPHSNEPGVPNSVLTRRRVSFRSSVRLGRISLNEPCEVTDEFHNCQKHVVHLGELSEKGESSTQLKPASPDQRC